MHIMHRPDCDVCSDEMSNSVNAQNDESEGMHYGECRGCGFYSHTLSNDDGYCGDCN